MRTSIKWFSIVFFAVLLAVFSYREGYEQAIVDKEVEAITSSLGGIISSHEKYQESLAILSDFSGSVIEDTMHMDHFIKKNTVSFELNEAGVLVVTMNDKVISVDGVMKQDMFEENIRGPLISSTGKPYFDMLVPMIYSSVSVSKGGLKSAVPGVNWD